MGADNSCRAAARVSRPSPESVRQMLPKGVVRQPRPVRPARDPRTRGPRPSRHLIRSCYLSAEEICSPLCRGSAIW